METTLEDGDLLRMSEAEKENNNNTPKCTEGSQDKCAKAQSDTCKCACNGENHGKDKRI